MTKKVLVADDSLTIQKVVKITLNDEPYSIIECKNYNDFDSIVEDEQPDLILLDFTLAENKSGYEVAKIANELAPNSQTLMMFGTFDTVDDDQLLDAGVIDMIVKPFDPQKFIQACSSILSNHEETISQAIPDKIISEVETQVDTNIDSNDEWSMSIPGVIGINDESGMELPPIIDGDSLTPEFVDEAKLPENEDLEYPDLEEMSLDDVDVEEITIERTLDPLPEFTPEPETEPISEVPIEHDEIELDLEVGEGTDTEEAVKRIEEQLQDELEDDLWALDEGEDETLADAADNEFQPLEPNEVYESLTPDQLVTGPIFSEQIAETDSTPHDLVDEIKQDINDLSVIPKDLEDKLRPIIEEYCQENIEKIAWEIIPELAENLIKEQLNKIADSIISKQ